MVTGLEILVAKVSDLRALSNLRATAHPESLSRPDNNRVVPHPGRRVNDQGSPSDGTTTKARQRTRTLPYKSAQNTFTVGESGTNVTLT